MASPIEPMQWLSMVASFVLVIILLVATLWLLRRMGGRTLRGATGRLAIVESLWLGPKQRLAIVRVDGCEVMIAITQQQVTLLTTLPVGPAPHAVAREAERDNAASSANSPVPGQADVVPISSGDAPDPAVAQRFRQLLSSWSAKLPGGREK